jgi:hypothetical protein
MTETKRCEHVEAGAQVADTIGTFRFGNTLKGEPSIVDVNWDLCDDCLNLYLDEKAVGAAEAAGS